MMALVSISFNSLILLYFVTTFQYAQVREGQERPTVPKPLFTMSSFSHRFITYKLSELKQVKE